MRRSSTIGTGLQRTPSSGGSGESSVAKNRRTTLDQLSGMRADDPVMQLADKERECERLEDEVESLKAQLALRPPKHELETRSQEIKELETLVAAYQRENEKSMRLTEGIKARERQLEQALEKHVGPAWAEMLEIPASPAPDRHLPSSSSTRTNLSSLTPSGLASTPIRPLNLLRQMSSSTATPTHLSQSFLPPSTPDSPAVEADETVRGRPGLSREEMDEMRAQVEGLRALMQGMERRVTRREGESAERLRRAEEEAERWRRGGERGVEAA